MTPSRYQHRPSGDEGLTLVELLVTMVIGGVVGTIAVVGVTSSLRFQRTIEIHSEAQQQAQLAVNQIASQVRSGNVLYEPEPIADGWRLTVYTQANGDQECVEWEMLDQAGELRTRSWAPDWSESGSPDQGEVSGWRTVTRSLLNGANGVQPFQVPADAPYGSRLLTVDLRVDDGGADSLRVTSASAGRNTVYEYDSQICGDRP